MATQLAPHHRSVQINWMTDEKVMRRELGRHGFSAWTKRLFGFGPGAGTGAR